MKPYFYDPIQQLSLRCMCVFVCVLNHVHWEQQTGDWDICEVGYAEVFVRTLNTNKDINTHTRAHIDTKERGEEEKKEWSHWPLISLLVEIYALERNHHHRHSITKETALRIKPHSLTHTNTFIQKRTRAAKATRFRCLYVIFTGLLWYVYPEMY